MTAARFTLAAIATSAVLAACLATAWLPATIGPGPLLTWAITYTAAVMGLAKAVHLPPARALAAATMLLAAAALAALTLLRNTLDALLPVLTRALASGTALLAKEA